VFPIFSDIDNIVGVLLCIQSCLQQGWTLNVNMSNSNFDLPRHSYHKTQPLNSTKSSQPLPLTATVNSAK